MQNAKARWHKQMSQSEIQHDKRLTTENVIEGQSKKPEIISSAVNEMRKKGISSSEACKAAFEFKRTYSGGIFDYDFTFCVEPAQQKYNEEMDGLLDGSRPIKSCNDWSLTREDKGWINPKFYMRYNPLADDRQKVSFTGKIKSIEGNNIFVTHEKPEGHLAETLSYALGYGYVEGASALVVFKKGNTYFTDVDRIVVGNYIKGVGISSGKTTASNAFGARTEIPVISAMCVE